MSDEETRGWETRQEELNIPCKALSGSLVEYQQAMTNTNFLDESGLIHRLIGL